MQAEGLASEPLLLPEARADGDPYGRGPLGARRVRGDALPENQEYPDNGCGIWDRCLTCPLPRCRYDEPGGARPIFLRERAGEIARLRRGDGVGIDELARRFGVSRRTVFRVLRRTTRQRRAS